MAVTPPAVLKAVQEANKAHPADVRAAIDDAIARVEKLPAYGEYAQGLIRQAVTDLLYEARHTANVRIRREAGRYGVGSKTTPQGQAAVNKVYGEVYQYRIAGTVLGKLLGSQLAAIADDEDELARGHRFNAELCRELAGRVGADQTVADAFRRDPRQLDRLFESVRRRVDDGPAAAAGD